MSHPRVEKVLETLGAGASLEALRPGWEDSMAARPAGKPPFLAVESLWDVLDYTGIDPCEKGSVAAMAERIAASEDLSALAWHCRRLLYEVTDYDAASLSSWPRLGNVLGAEADYFYFILALASVEYIRRKHAELEMPPDLTRDTCADVWRYRPCHVGQRVRIPETLAWARHAPAGRLFKIGRFQYIHSTFPAPLVVLRRHSDRLVLALAETGQKFNRQGYCDGDGGIHDPEAWTTTLSIDEHRIRGFPMTPMGYALRREVTLRLDEWTPCLLRGTPVLDMHIPPVEPLTLEAAGASMRRAISVFARYLPERVFRAFSCRSWLFNTQWAEVLGERSNISAWQREHYLYPVPSPKPCGLEFIFGHRPFDIAKAPRETRLQQGALAILERGEPLRCGGMFGLPEDLPDFGRRYYRARWDDAIAALR